MPFPNGLQKYEELSSGAKDKLQKAGILNGCGPQSWAIRPNWFFKADCYLHDYNYAAGGTESDRRWADWGFYTHMLKDLKRLPWWLQPFARIEAWFFYRAVRWFGKSSFNYGKQPMNIDRMIERLK